MLRLQAPTRCGRLFMWVLSMNQPHLLHFHQQRTDSSCSVIAAPHCDSVGFLFLCLHWGLNSVLHMYGAITTTDPCSQSPLLYFIYLQYFRYIILRARVLCLHVCLCTLYAWCPQRSEEAIRCPGTGIRHGCEQPCVCWKPNLTVCKNRYL